MKPPLVAGILGTLHWDDNLDWYSGTVKDSVGTIKINLETDDNSDISSTLRRANKIVKQLDHYRCLAADFAVDGLLGIKNECWLDEDEKEVKQDDFKARMFLETIIFSSDGEVAFWHTDGDLFCGHSILVCIDKDDKCVNTDIPG